MVNVIQLDLDSSWRSEYGPCLSIDTGPVSVYLKEMFKAEPVIASLPESEGAGCLEVRPSVYRIFRSHELS